MKHLILLLLLFHPSSAFPYSKTLADWCRSDHLIGDPLGLPANKRFDSKKNTCTQTFGIFDKERAEVVCDNKAPFPATYSFDPNKGVTCVWATTANCPNDKNINFYNDCIELVKAEDCKQPFIMTSLKRAKFLSVILRDYGVKAVQIKMMDTKASHKMIVPKHGFGKDGFVKHGPEEWKPALVIPSEPMLKISSGSIVRTDTKALNTLSLCKVTPVRQSGSEGHVDLILSRNVYQPGIKTDMHDLDVMKFHKICAKRCDGCYASHEPRKGKEGVFWVPVHRKSDKKHDSFDQCNGKSDPRQLKQFFQQEFPGSSAVMADDTKWTKDLPSAECAAGPRSGAVFFKDGWHDFPPIVRRFLFCTNGARTDKEGKASCVANSHLVSGVCQCKDGFIDVHEVSSGFNDEKEMYEKGMYCVKNCVQNSEHVGTSCKCKKGFVDVHDVDGFHEDKRKYSKGQFCLEKIDCGKNAVANYGTKSCDCDDGYIPRKKDKKEKDEKDVKAEYCVKRRVCQQNSEYKDGENICECKEDYINIVTLYDPRSSDYDEEDGFCVKKIKCADNAEEVKSPDGKPTNECKCKNGLLDIHDSDLDKSSYDRGQMCLTTTTTTTKKPLTKGVSCVELTKKMRFTMMIDESGSINGCYGYGCQHPNVWSGDVVPFLIEIGKLLNKKYTTVDLCYFSGTVNCEYTLEPGWTQSEFENKIKSHEYAGGVTVTREAMERAFLTMGHVGSSEEKIILLVSDGAPALKYIDSMYPYNTVARVDQLKRQHPDVKVLAAGIGPDLHGLVGFGSNNILGMDILKKIASTEKDAVFAGEFAALQADAVKNIMDKRCEDVWG